MVDYWRDIRAVFAKPYKRFAMDTEMQKPKLPPTEEPTSIFLKCGHIIVIDGTNVTLDDGKAPLHECCVEAIAGELTPK